jgi:translation initiation factor 1
MSSLLSLGQQKFTVIFRIEKGGRGGKTVTVMTGFPRNHELLESLTKELKKKCGVGGTFAISSEEAMIEIQGDQRDRLKKILTEMGVKFKGM